MKKFGGIVAAALVAAAAAGLQLSAIEQPEPSPGLAKATFAGGCFWSMEHVFDELAGVVSVTVGYSGGSATNPSYQQVELALEDSHRFKRIATQIVPASTFWRAEPYHQHFYKTNAFEYRMYRVACGRDPRLADLWGKDHR